jgi:hypothetical protein
MRVTPENFPQIYKALDLITRDNGGINRVEPEREYYEVPEKWALHLSNINAVLSTLNNDEFVCFCVEDSGGLVSFAPVHPLFKLAGEFLDAFFNEWEGGDAKA